MSTSAIKYYKTIIDSSYKTILSNKWNYWNEYDKEGSIPMIRNYGENLKSSNKITISGCTWNTSYDLSTINYLYFFVDKQQRSISHTESSLSITNSKRKPLFKSTLVNNIPYINVYSSRIPYLGSDGSQQILADTDYIMGDISNKIISFKNNNGHTYGLTGNYNGYQGSGIELYIHPLNDYRPEYTGIMCISNTTPLFSDYSLNTCGDNTVYNPNTWGPWPIYNYGELSSCMGRCAEPKHPTPPPSPPPSPPPTPALNWLCSHPRLDTYQCIPFACGLSSPSCSLTKGDCIKKCCKTLPCPTVSPTPSNI